MKARGKYITPTPPEVATDEAAAAEAASFEMEGRDPEVDVAATVFLGRWMGIPMTLKALGGQGRTPLRTEGLRD